EFRRGRSESLLTYYNRLINLAEDVTCGDMGLLVSKFLDGLDNTMGNGLDNTMGNRLRMKVYEMGADTTLDEVFELAEKMELAQRKYEAYRPRTMERSRRPTWAAAIIPEEKDKAVDRGENRPETRTCHRCGQPGHICKDCKNCDSCGKPGHRRRECPEAPKCEICGRGGHAAKDCYQREGAAKKKLEEQGSWKQISRLQAQLQALGPRHEAEAGMYARDEEEEDVAQEEQGALMAWGVREDDEVEHEEQPGYMTWRGREEMGLRSGGKDGRREQVRKERERGQKPEEKEERCTAARHPQERLACQTSVLLIQNGALTVEGEKAKTAIIDTGAQSVILGKGMAEKLGLWAPDRHVMKGMLVMTAEGGESKWMPCTRAPIELTVLKGEKHEMPVRIRCGISESEDFDVLVGTEMIFASGMTICFWKETVEFRTRWWRKGEPLGQLPVQFVKTEPKRAYRADQKEVTAKQGAQEGVAGAGLAAVVRNGIAVKQWIYVEQAADVRKIAEHHAWELHREFPELLRGDVIKAAMSRGVNDVKAITKAEVASWGHVDLLVAGWECQGVSWAGKGKGELDPKTKLMEELFKIMEWVQARQGRLAYLLEHLDMEDVREPVRLVRERVTRQVGKGVSSDAARMGAYAHRLRMYWQNVVPVEDLQREIEGVQRAEGRKGAAGYRMDGEQPGPRLVLDHRKGRWEVPTALERELAMGYKENATAAPGVNEKERRRALGNAMDGYMMRWLVQRMWKETVLHWGLKEGENTVATVRQGVWACLQKEEPEWRIGLRFHPAGVGKCKIEEMALKLSSEEPVFHRRRKMPLGDEEICREKIKELLEAGLIRRSESEYATPTVVAARKDLTGEVLSRRMCGDYRDLNKITVPDRYPMPMAEELFDKLADGVFFTTLDLRQGFNQIKIREEDPNRIATPGGHGEDTECHRGGRAHLPSQQMQMGGANRAILGQESNGAERDAAGRQGMGVGREAEGGAARLDDRCEDGDIAAAAGSRPALHPLHRLEQSGDGGNTVPGGRGSGEGSGLRQQELQPG
ncbi:unnamed protein product, partial [Closterium sp. NIES-53]